MSAARLLAAALLVLSMMLSGPGPVWAGYAPSPPPPAAGAPPGPDRAQGPTQSTEGTPSRLSYINGEVSFWRPGAADWAPAKLNTPLEPGDVLYTGQRGNVEIEVGSRAFVRAAEGTQIGLDNQELDFVQLRVTAGQAALDLRALPAGHTVELDTPNAAFTIEHPGYYHVDVAENSVTFRTHRGGSAVMRPAGGTATPIAANRQAVVAGMDSPRVDIGPAPQLTAWDRWNYQRTDSLLRPTGASYVPPAIYGAHELDRFGSWRVVETYGPVWVPRAVPASWVPYSTGRWIWDPIYGWTWLDDAPWGWAPYHYGRWVFVGNSWAWAPGPIVVGPAYSPGLVVFLGGGVSVSFGRPLSWAPLGWGEPVIPWWGRPGFVGVPWWGGWGGPRVVNNVVINNTTVVNAQNITVYRNVHVVNAVVGVPVDGFGRGHVQPARLSHADVQRLTPMRGALSPRPVATSVMPATGAALRPPPAAQARGVVATRPPRDFAPTLRAHGLTGTPATTTSRLVRSTKPAAFAANAAAPSAQGTAPAAALGAGSPAASVLAQRRANGVDRPSSPPPPGSPKMAAPLQRTAARPDAAVRPEPPWKDSRLGAAAERRLPQTGPPSSHPAQQQAGPSRRTPPPWPAGQSGSSPRGPEEARPEPRVTRLASPPQSPPRPEAPPAHVERPARVEPPARVERVERVEPPGRIERPGRVEPQAGIERPQAPPVAPPSRGSRPGQQVARPEPPGTRSMPTPSPALRAEAPPARTESPARMERPTRIEPSARIERPEPALGPRPQRGERIGSVERPINQFHSPPALQPALRSEPPHVSRHVASGPEPGPPHSRRRD